MQKKSFPWVSVEQTQGVLPSGFKMSGWWIASPPTIVADTTDWTKTRTVNKHRQVFYTLTQTKLVFSTLNRTQASVLHTDPNQASVLHTELKTRLVFYTLNQTRFTFYTLT